MRRTPAKKGKKAQTAVVCGGLGNALGTGKETLLMKIGFWELIVIVIVAFVFIGPDQLPVYAKKIGKMLRELKKYTGAASEEIQKNVVEPLNEIQAPLKEAVAPLTDIKKDIDSSMRDVTKSFTGIGKTSKEEAAKKLAETEEVTDLTEDAVEELPEQPAEAPAETVEAPAEKPEQAAAEAAQPAAEPVAEPVQEAPAAAEEAAEAAPAEEAKAIRRMLSGRGPMKAKPELSTCSAKSAFSERKP